MMVISRGLHVLLWCGLVLALASTRDQSASAPRRRLGIRSDSNRARRKPGTKEPRARSKVRWISGRLQARQDRQCSDPASCSDVERSFIATILRTVTAGMTTRTEIVYETASLTLTVVDPGLLTQTDTVTVTGSGPTRATEATGVRSQVEGGASTAEAAGAGADAGADVATGLAAIDLTTTVTGTGTVTVTSTVLRTVFVTVTIAPSATTTEVATTTVQPTQDSNSLPSDWAPPDDRDVRSRSPISSETTDTLPSGTGADSSVTGTSLPSVTDVLDTGTLTTDNPQSRTPTSSPPSAPDGAQRPIEGLDLTADEIAGVALGIIFGVLFFVLAGFLTYRLVARRRNEGQVHNHREIPSSASAPDSGAVSPSGSITDAGNLAQTSRTRLAPVAHAANHSPSTDLPPLSNEIRVVIRQTTNGKNRSSGSFPGSKSRASSSSERESVAIRGQWPRPPGYEGRPYSFIMEESRGGSVSVVDEGWSEKGEDGSREGSVKVAGGESRSGSGAGVGRELSP